MLNKLLEEESAMILNRPWKTETVGIPYKNFWLIQLSNKTPEQEMPKLFKFSHLRFDTMAFSFVINGSMLNLYTKKQLIIIYYLKYP